MGILERILKKNILSKIEFPLVFIVLDLQFLRKELKEKMLE